MDLNCFGDPMPAPALKDLLKVMKPWIEDTNHQRCVKC